MLYMLFLTASLLMFSQPEWTWSVHPESGFKVLTPFSLIHEERQVPTELGVIQFHQYHGGSVADTLAPVAIVIDHYILPSTDPVTDADYLDEFFESTIDELLTSIDGVLVYMDVIHQPGREVCIWKGSYDQGRGIIRGNLMLYNDHYFGMQVFGLEKNKPDAMMSKFLDSFKRISSTSP
jgi:hypothetical protein